ncbi:hypothetical protein J6Z19_01705 [bacterium]|nr:hypothetical protein [bacterium]
MRTRFLFLFFALFLVAASCSGSDPLSESEIDENLSQDSENIDNSLPDPTTSEEGNDSDAVKSDEKDENDKIDDSDSNNSSSDTDETTSDDADSVDDSSDSQPDNDDDSTNDSGDSVSDSDDDDTNPTDNDTDTADSTSDADTDVDTDSGEADLTVILPFGGAPVDKTIKLDTKITRIDVLLMVDLYSSMSAAHDNLKANVKTAIMDGIRAKLPDTAFGLVTLGVVEAGTAYNLVQPVTTDTNSVRNAVDGIAKVTSGTRTYHGLALWEAASGEEDKEYLILCENNAVCNAKYKTISINPVDCSGQIGNIGGACFRENAMPVFVMASSQNFNNFLRKKNNGDSYDEWRESVSGNTYTPEKTAVKAAAKMNEINAKFIGVSYKTSNPVNGFKTVAKNTASQDAADSDSGFNIFVEEGDDTFSAKIAEQVNFLTENILLKVKAEMKHVDNEYGVTGTAQFVKSFYPTAVQTVKAGTQLILDTVTFENNFYENTACEPHVFHITLEATGEGLVLDSRDIKIIVPGRDCGENHW